MLLGVRVHGTDCTDVSVGYDPTLFKAVPVPEKLGVPLMWKKQPGTGGDDSHIRSSAIVRVMSDPDDGFAPMDWQYGGNLGPAPPVVLARKDKIPFSSHDWCCLNAYIGEWLDAAADAEDDRAVVNKEYLTPVAFQTFVRSHTDDWPLAFLPLQFPIGSTVEPQGLSVEELNGSRGVVVQFSRDRVGVRFIQFPDRAPVAIKAERLKLVQEAPLVAEEHEASAAKRLATADAKLARNREVFKQDALAIARRFIDCLMQDTFPERGDLHLFGLGTGYQARATEVLAVWQGAAKLGVVTEESLVEALCKDGNKGMKEYFEGVAREIADSRSANATYAKELIKAKFATLEWDDL